MAPPPTDRRHRTASGLRTFALRILQVATAAALAADAYIHADLAPAYDPVGQHISQGTLFRVEAAAASLAALLVLLLGRRRPVWAFAFLVSLTALVCVVLYRYVDVGAIGPLPNMYEPTWFPEKTASAVAVAVGTVTSFAGFRITGRPR
ncbi:MULTISPECIES: hypothetical protein [Kitasatospora]|uniref:Integral membrane protein n=1 Tax=Kitasatospora cystarginea TaxID=58350 RepID=A0ABN3EVB0_9ACTN